MSGAKRRTKYRKQVESDILDALPEPEEDEVIVEMIASRGGNLLEVRNEHNETGLCRLPSKFRKLVWVKRGTYLIVKTGLDDFVLASGEKGKVTYTVVHILFKDQVKHLKSIGKWPESFMDKAELEKMEQEVEESDGGDDESHSGSDSDDSLFQNRNRIGGGFDESSDEESETSESEEEYVNVESVDDSEDVGESNGQDESGVAKVADVATGAEESNENENVGTISEICQETENLSISK